MHDLNGKAVLIVGGSSGLGLATAIAASAAGASVTIASRSSEKLAAAKAQTPALETAVLDSSDEAAVDAFFGDGRVWDHIMVTPSAVKTGSARTLATVDAMAGFNSKFWSGYRVARHARIAAEGSLTLVSGVRSQRPNPSVVLQTAINAAVEGLARGLALELAPVRVNAISPGIIETPLFNAMTPEARDALYANLRTTLPVRRVGAAVDVAQAALFLMTNPYVTGTTLVIDGGSLLTVSV